MQKYLFKSESFEAIQLPYIAEKRGKDWIEFGSNNLYPDLLIELFNNSAIHATSINAKTDAITGEGFRFFGDDVINSKGETIDEVFAKIALDYLMFGGYSLNVIWSKDGENIAELWHLPFNNVRSGVMNEDEEVEHYYYSGNWANVRKFPPRAYAAYSTTENKKDNASQVVYYFDYTLGNSYYPLPSYVAAINTIDTDSRISKFHRSNLQSGMAPSMMMTFRNGIPTADEQSAIWRDIQNTFGGEENAGKFMINFSEPGREPTLEAIAPTQDSYYVVLGERISSIILTSHRITSPMLLGIKDASGFSSNADEIQTAFNHFMGTVIAPDQKKLVKSFNKIINQMGRTIKLEVIPSNILYTIETGPDAGQIATMAPNTNTDIIL